MTNQNKMREQFEEECAEWEMDTSRDSEGDYVDRQTRRGWNLWQAATAYAGAATPKAAQGGVGGRLHQIAEPAGDELPESVIDAVAEALGDAYDCGRVWSAWSYGTMGPDDFSMVAEDAERVAEIARSAINADRAMRAQAAPGAAQPAAMLTRAQIRDVFLSNGFTIKEGQTDLKEYVYEAAYALLALAAAPQPPAQAPVAQGDAIPREDFAWLVVQEACETDPADEDDPECIRILRRDLKSAVLAAFLRYDAENHGIAWDAYQAGHAAAKSETAAPVVGRWYCVANDGAATLCVDEADARESAAEADIAFPRMAPHRAVQLVPAEPTQEMREMRCCHG